MTKETKDKLKAAAGIAAVIGMATFMLQNLDQVELSFLTIALVVPVGVLVLLSVGLGVGLGYLLARRKRSSGSASADPRRAE